MWTAKRAMVALGVVACLGGVAACTAPKVNLRQATLGKVTTTGFRINLDLNVFNPNEYALPLETVR